MIYSIRFKIYFQIGKGGSFKYTQSRLTSPEIRIFSKELPKTVKEKNKKDVLILFNNAIGTHGPTQKTYHENLSKNRLRQTKNILLLTGPFCSKSCLRTIQKLKEMD